MKAVFAIAALLVSLGAATPTYDPRDITHEGLWKRDCPGSPVPNPVCPPGEFWCGPADGKGQCYGCGTPCD
ncbi:hypothetical protein F5Y16DRAFT_403928 [Xylariaceae sp. FL0255]|nr:hypothetical protein F5Y16DRAFT_403928 [Xylariaceae sp. FL0255]